MKKVALHTLGCKLNFAETASIGRQFLDRGYEVVDYSEPSDVFVLNTCSVTERADRECRQLIRRVRRNSPGAYVIVMGCYAQLRPEEVKSIEGVDLILGAKEKFNLFEFTQTAVKESGPKVHVTPIAEIDTFGIASSSASSDRTRAFLKIQDGCDYSCSFCTIPLARGASRSIPIEDIRLQAIQIARQGYKEIVLTGVNVGDYGRKIQTDLLSLLRNLVTVDGIERIRISSIEPNLLTEDLVDFWLSERKLCNHFHIPLQSGHDTILASMRRRYKTAYYAGRVERIKSIAPEACIGADVLVGFPGETDDVFEQSYRMLRDLPLSYLHTFTYSERPNTPAIQLENRVEPRERAERSERLRMLGVRKRRRFHESFVGKSVNVLFEHEQEEGWWSGFTEQYVRVMAQPTGTMANQIHSATIVSANNENCIGELVAGCAEIAPMLLSQPA
jgi:threonylcarbamoyladenosine tRNA methylthiotransferase MtaB